MIPRSEKKKNYGAVERREEKQPTMFHEEILG